MVFFGCKIRILLEQSDHLLLSVQEGAGEPRSLRFETAADSQPANQTQTLTATRWLTPPAAVRVCLMLI